MAGKRKNPADNWMPSRVSRGRSAYEFKHPDGRTIRLCPLDATQSAVWVAYEKFTSQKEDKVTFKTLADRFLSSAEFTDLAFDSQKDYQKYAKKVMPVFGKMDPNNIKPEHIRKYMDKRGLKSKTQANREKTFMSRVFGWSYERGYVKGNPCKGVRQFKEKSRERYITDAEYDAVYAVAPDTVKVAMEIAYLCCARQADVLALSRSQILEPGIFIRQGKTGAKQIKAWSDRLRSAITLADTLPIKDGISSVYVIHQRNGNRYTRDGFNTQWRNAKLAAIAANPDMDFDFTYHDLKAKGISDLDGSLTDKQAISGHKNASQTAIYDRKVKIVPVVGNQKG
ncbi:tyrosine-type recombinase/integrase [Serratia sp. CY76391]|uniref:tyrosine-type recombinase/integrase n=1 Tax=Serratia sp. CY76391 TaxID=3383681 RepID=UPI003F9FCCFC